MLELLLALPLQYIKTIERNIVKSIIIWTFWFLWKHQTPPTI